MGQIEESVASYRKAISIKPDFPQAFCNLGNTLKELGLLEDAAANLQKFIASWPDLAEAEVHVNLGNTLKDLGRFEDAVLSYRKALVLKPDFAEVHLNIGNVFHEQGRLEDALACYQKANTINPGFVETYRNLGIVYQKLGRQEDAVTSFKKALEIRPDYAEAHRNLGQTFRKQGRMEEAKKSYARALEINPGLDDVSYSLSALSGETTEKAPESYVRKLFDSYAKGFDDHLANKLGYKIPALMRKSVDGVTDVQETFQRALDLGCGTGLVAESFLDRIKKIDGVDLSPKMLEQAETKAVYNTLYRQDLLEFLEGPEIQESEYDLVLSADTFIYVGRLDQIFAAVGRALKDGGLFVFSVEQLDKGDYKLLSSGRYSQSNAYITNLATDYGFSIVICDPVVIRTENNQPIPGNIFILRAAT
jgi:predicted TPR repeat methyltransferase